MQVDVLQGLLPAAVLVGEVHMVKINAAVRNCFLRLGRIGHIRGFVQDFGDPAILWKRTAR